MAIRTIIHEGDDLLLKHSRAVTDFDERLHVLLDDMAETMHKAEGVGLAAVQVGSLRRAVVIDVGEGVIELINPVITEQKGVQETDEGCLSLPGKLGLTRRPNVVTVEYLDRYGDPHTITGKGLLAKAFCHEIDHLDGILFTEHVIRWEN